MVRAFKGNICNCLVLFFFQTDPNEAQEVAWFLHQAPHTTDHDEETYVRGKHVISSSSSWTGVDLLHRVMSVSGPAKQALWCNFQSDCFVKSTLCIAESSCLSTFEKSGASFAVPVPFPVSTIFALQQGIIVARNVPSTVSSKVPQHPIVPITLTLRAPPRSRSRCCSVSCIRWRS